MLSQRLAFLTSRIIRVAFLTVTAPVFLSACFGQGDEQVHGMLDVAYATTAVCQAQTKSILFRNVSGDELVINGVTISQGTDPQGNFKLLSVTVGSDKTAASAGILHDIHIPSGSNYSFQVSYVPHTENEDDTAVLDIAYTAPKEGVIQVSLSGSSTTRAATCPTDGGGGTTNGVGDLQGDMTITITRLALVSSQISAPVTTDADQTVTPFVPVTIPIHFDGGANSVTLPAISSSVNFALPHAKNPPLSTAITGTTFVTTTGDVTGTYGDDGSITLENVPVHLEEKFHADFVVTLTTGTVDIPASVLPVGLLDDGGFAVSSDRTKISGSVIDATSKNVKLIGISTFTNAGGTGTVAGSIGGSSGAVLIEATINPPSSS